MDLKIENQTFIVCGASSGFGKGTAKALIRENASVIGIARNLEKLKQTQLELGDNFIPFQGDISQTETINELVKIASEKKISGILINAGGPPAMSFNETELSDWDNAYQNLLRWKVDIVKKLLPYFENKQYGRIVFIESSSVKQPIENLILSTSLRLAVLGMMKTLSQEIQGQNITFNMIAPGSHATPAIERLIKKKSEIENISYNEAKEKWEENIPAGKMGDPNDLGQLAAWLLSPSSKFVNGQVYAVDGGTIKSTL
ncbi:MAG: short-chain dehydrogenase [Salinivirgaceae bacterium]|nr:MAG: short-chain dehydrogenase [Salinivirgaceae bacterium]